MSIRSRFLEGLSRFVQVLNQPVGRKTSDYRKSPLYIGNWFETRFDQEFIYLKASPPGREPWEQQFRWDEITRIGYQCEDLGASDGLYFFTTRRPQSYVVPVEAKGGDELWNEIIERNLFDADLAIEAASCSEQRIFFWPPPEKDDALKSVK